MRRDSVHRLLGDTQLELKRDSDLVKFFINYFIAELLFFVGTGILVIIKMVFSLNMDDILEGTFIGPASSGVFQEAFSPAQIDWIFTNLLIWWMNMFIALFNSLLLITGVFAVTILVPLDVRIFEGPNAIQIEAMPVGFLFLVFWGIFPILYIVRSTFFNWGNKIKRLISPTTT